MAEVTGIRNPMGPLGIAASGLSAQRARIDVAATNIANSETTRGPDGAPYRRKIVTVREIPFTTALDRAATDDVGSAGGVTVTGVEEDFTEGPLVYDPGHPHADAEGYVRMPNVSITEEMADLMDARRLFEANASVFQAVKNMLRRAAQL